MTITIDLEAATTALRRYTGIDRIGVYLSHPDVPAPPFEFRGIEHTIHELAHLLVGRQQVSFARSTTASERIDARAKRLGWRRGNQEEIDACAVEYHVLCALEYPSCWGDKQRLRVVTDVLNLRGPRTVSGPQTASRARRVVRLASAIADPKNKRRAKRLVAILQRFETGTPT